MTFPSNYETSSTEYWNTNRKSLKSCSLVYCSSLDLVDICFLFSSNFTGVMKTPQVTKGTTLLLIFLLFKQFVLMSMTQEG
jgi:hypothetical protein